MHDIVIKRVRNGVVVHVGCQTFVETNIALAMKHVKDYLYNPTKAQKWWDENFPPLEPARLHLEPQRSPFKELVAAKVGATAARVTEAPDEPSL